jgi:hypothetical protein
MDLVNSSWMRFLDPAAFKLVNAGNKVDIRLPGMTQVLDIAS